MKTTTMEMNGAVMAKQQKNNECAIKEKWKGNGNTFNCNGTHMRKQHDGQ